MPPHACRRSVKSVSAVGADVLRSVKDDFDGLLEYGILAHGFLRLRFGDCEHDKLVANSIKRCGYCPLSGIRRLAQMAARLLDPVIPRVPVRPPVLSLPILLGLLLAAQPSR